MADASSAASETDSEDGGKKCVLAQALVEVGGKTLTFDVDSTTTVLQLKRLIFNRSGYLPERTNISFHQRVIADPARLSALDLSADPEHVHLVAELIGLPGGTKVCSVFVLDVLCICA